MATSLSLPRRGFLTGMLAACAAPAIIRTPGLLMPIKPGLALSRPWMVNSYLELRAAGLQVGDVFLFLRRADVFAGIEERFDQYIVTATTGAMPEIVRTG